MSHLRNQGPVGYRMKPAYRPVAGAGFMVEGVLGERLRAAVDGWLLTAPEANPALLDMFRDRSGSRELVPWAGEFAGKYLVGAQQIARLRRDRQLEALIHRVVDQLLRYQTCDGYLGPFPDEERLVRHWDVWGHYHIMLALLAYYEDTSRADALQACTKMARLFHEFFVVPGRRMITEEDPDGEKNYAVAHGLARLFAMTGDETARAVADWIAREWQVPPAGRYVHNALSGAPIWEWPVKRWESLHDLQAIGELALLDGNAEYRTAFEHAWWSILEGDRHNTGGITSAETCQGNPYDPRAIETCCTVAWIALSVDMLRVTGCSRVADEIELSTFNGLMGAQHPSGRWWTYNTPMDGVRKSSAHDIVFQARPGSPELNCCSANAPRGLGMLDQWAVMASEDGSEHGFVLNCYGPGVVTAPLPGGGRVRLRQETRYPLDGRVKLIVEPSDSHRFALSLRIPAWSERTRVSINGEAVRDVAPGAYLRLSRAWRDGDCVDLELDMTPHFWLGERECAGKLSVYAGPILLAFDTRWNPMSVRDIPALDPNGLHLAQVRPKEVGSQAQLELTPPPWLLFAVCGTDGRRVLLCDFANAGVTGTEYSSWLPSAAGRSALPFSRKRPRWACRQSDRQG